MKNKLYTVFLTVVTFALGIGWIILTGYASGVVAPDASSPWYLIPALGMMLVFLWVFYHWMRAINHPRDRKDMFYLFMYSLVATVSKPFWKWIGQLIN